MTDSLLTLNDQMEGLSGAYVGAVAARAGYMRAEPYPDRDSLDCMLLAGGDMRPQIGVQNKATTAAPINAQTFSFPLKIKNYNDLRIQTQAPRILVVLALPEDSNDWLVQNLDHLIIKRCAYWKSLLGMPVSTNETSVTIEIDTSNVFDSATLVALMDRSRQGLPL